MKSIVITLLVLIARIKVADQPKPEIPIIVYGERVTLNSEYLFGVPVKYNTSNPSHPNWGGLRRSWHNSNAWDLFAEAHTPVYSMIDGYVFATRFRENGRTVWGHNIIMENCEEKVFYTHLDEVILCPGDSIKRGQLIGYVGKWPVRYRLPDGTPMPSHVHIALYKGNLNDYLDNSLRFKEPLSKHSMLYLVMN